MRYICTKNKGKIRIGNKKYYKGDPLPEDHKVPQVWIDKGIVVAEGKADVMTKIDAEAKVKANIDAKAKADADAKAKADADAKTKKK